MSHLTALGANIFAGGFTVGVRKHFKVLGHLEHDDGYGAETASRNLKIPVYIGMNEWPKDFKAARVNFLYSNPPCAIWSVASGRGGESWRSDPRLQRIRDIFSLVDRYHPEVWCWESVCQAYTRGFEFVRSLTKEAKKRGYSATYLLIDAAYLGTPQHRKRFFLVLHRVAIDWQVPNFAKTTTAGEALRGVKPDKTLMTKLSNRVEGKVLSRTKPGELLSRVFDRLVKKPKIGPRGQKLGRPSFLKRRLDPTQPATTVIGNAMFHHKENRFLTVNETAALAGFPPKWEWPKSDGYNLVARGVMPPVGEWLARHVATAIRKGKKIKPTAHLVDFRTAPGLIREVGDVPAADLGMSVPKKKRTNGSEMPSRINRPISQLAEATRRGIPDRAEMEKIRSAVRLLRNGKATLPTSGLLIRARLVEGERSDHEIVAEVLKKFKGRKTTVADVSYHKGKLRRAGMIA